MTNATKVTQTGETVLDKIVDVIIPPKIVSFLNITLYENSFMIFNYWSFVHFFSGAVFYFFFPNMEIKRKFKLWVIINLVYEVVEFLLALGGHPLFVEEFVDIVWDIIISLSGFLVIWGLRNLGIKVNKKYRLKSKHK